MNRKIDNPKVFISYAWGTDEYQAKVLAFATSLMQDGVDVVFDKWSLKEGNDTYAYMESCVTDESVTNVIILLDPTYSKKADDRKGGVGTETQIISPEIYGKVTQEKFIPVVFERDDNGEIKKPVFLNGTLHFDLSLTDKYDEEYTRLVKRLYGVEVFQKPEIGKKPIWVDNPMTSLSIKAVNSYDILKQNIPEQAKCDLYKQYLEEIFDAIFRYKNDANLDNADKKLIEIYNELLDFRNNYLVLLRYSSYVNNSVQLIARELENGRNKLDNHTCILSDIKKILLHEIFLYTIAHFLKNDNYKNVGYILGKTYFSSSIYSTSVANNVNSYSIFYCGSDCSEFDNAVNGQDNKNYYSGTANYWVNNINISFCSKEDFVLADLICFNYSVFGKTYLSDWKWFPLSYVYGGGYNYCSTLFEWSKHLYSLEFLNKAIDIFNFKDIDEFKQKYATIETEVKKGSYRDYRHQSCFNPAPLISQFVSSDKLGNVK